MLLNTGKQAQIDIHFCLKHLRNYTLFQQQAHLQSVYSHRLATKYGIGVIKLPQKK